MAMNQPFLRASAAAAAAAFFAASTPMEGPIGVVYALGPDWAGCCGAALRGWFWVWALAAQARSAAQRGNSARAAAFRTILVLPGGVSPRHPRTGATGRHAGTSSSKHGLKSYDLDPDNDGRFSLQNSPLIGKTKAWPHWHPCGRFPIVRRSDHHLTITSSSSTTTTTSSPDRLRRSSRWGSRRARPW